MLWTSALAAWASFAPAMAHGQSTPAAEDGPPQHLRASPLLQEQIDPAVRERLPLFIRGDRLEGQTGVDVTIDGDAELRRGDTAIHAEHMRYDAARDQAQARGAVRMNRAGNVYEGTVLDLQVGRFEGFFSQARYRFLATDGHGQADRIDFLDPQRSTIHQATYTTCRPEDELDSDGAPQWLLRAERIELDTGEQVGHAHNARLEFLGLSLPALPSMSFPLSDKRKSGLLPPTIIPVDSRSGPTLALPYYWNIAPNRDATLTPTLMGWRGLALGAEFRYLEPHYGGTISANILPSDQKAKKDRWAMALQHNAHGQILGRALGLTVNLNRVSDDDYWRDFPRTSGAQWAQLAQRLLPNDAALHWGDDESRLTLRTLKWQTLQDINAPIVPPYDRLPQILWRYRPQALAGGLDAGLELESTRFEAVRALTGQPNAQRSHALAHISRPFLAPWGFVTPRLQLHSSHYQFANAFSEDPFLPASARAPGRRASRSLPTVSLDSGLFFERPTQYLGRDFVQTLEPRAFYTYTPYRDQSHLPLYDTAANDFNFATVFTENAYTGNDRIADNNLLTLGLTSRLLHPQTGAELLRLGVAQRLRFSEQRVTLPGEAPRQERLSDLLLGAGVHWSERWSADATAQYNPKMRESVRSNLSAHYRPGAYRTLSAAYRFQRDMSEQVDLGWQWPLHNLWSPSQDGRMGAAARGTEGSGGRWYSVGRLNYSTREHRLVDAVVGLEYDSCCWIGRVVLERLQSGYATPSTRLLLQIEFVGFARVSLGANPLASLQQNIPHYQSLREMARTPSRFTQYD